MTYADGFIISMIALSLLFAWVRGISREVLTLIAIGVGALAVFFFGEPFSGLFGDGVTGRLIGLGVLFLLAFIGASIALEIVVSSLLGSDPQRPDQIVGAIFGLVRGWLLVGLAFLASTYYLDENNMPEPIENAKLKGVATSAANLLERMGLEKEYSDNESSEETKTDQ